MNKPISFGIKGKSGKDITSKFEAGYQTAIVDIKRTGKFISLHLENNKEWNDGYKYFVRKLLKR